MLPQFPKNRRQVRMKSISKNSEQVEEEAGNLAESADQLADQVKQFQI